MNLRTRVRALEAAVVGSTLDGVSAQQQADIGAAVRAWMVTRPDGDLLAVVNDHLDRPAGAPVTEEELTTLARIDAAMPHGTTTAAEVLRHLASAVRKVQA